MTDQYFLVFVANGKILCRRCLAKSSRTGQQCGRPALKRSKTQKCQFHGGRGSGPKTAEGRARIAVSLSAHGNETRTLRASRAQASRRLAELEDALRILGLTSAARTPGRKPAGYQPLTSMDDVKRWFLDKGGN